MIEKYTKSGESNGEENGKLILGHILYLLDIQLVGLVACHLLARRIKQGQTASCRYGVQGLFQVFQIGSCRVEGLRGLRLRSKVVLQPLLPSAISRKP